MSRPRYAPGAGSALRPGIWLALVWMATAAIFLDMRSESLAALDFGDTDDAMRLVQTRDLLDGQSWFDRRQTRLAPPDGVEMHWSRLPDAALAGLIAASRPLVGPEAAERFAVAAWPLLLLLAWLTLLVRLGRRFAGSQGGLAALFLGLLAVPASAQFLPGRIDHHGLQIVLSLALLLALLEMRERSAAGAAAGAIAVLMLSVGLESLPLILAGEAGLAALWARAPDRLAPALRLHGLALAALAPAALAATLPPSAWSAVRCDAFSIVYAAACGVAAGLWLAAAAIGPGVARPERRFALLAAAGLAGMAGLFVAFPECRSGPYGAIDAQLAALWLSHVREAQPVTALLTSRPDTLAAFLGFPLLGLAAVAVALRREGPRPDWLLLGALVLAAALTSLWQIRGAYFANSFAVLPAAWLLARLLAKAAMLTPQWKQAAASIAALALVNGMPFALAGQALAPASTSNEADGSSACTKADSLKPLAQRPPAIVLASIDSGPAILLHTDHGVLAAPYHRNTEGLHAAIAVWTAAPDAAHALALERGLGLIAVCASAPDLRLFAARAPDGLAAALLRGDRPEWLLPVGPADRTGLELYRVANGSGRVPAVPP